VKNDEVLGLISGWKEVLLSEVAKMGRNSFGEVNSSIFSMSSVLSLGLLVEGTWKCGSSILSWK